MAEPSVEERIRGLLQAGDVATAATEALRCVGPAVLRYLRSMLRDEAAAADAFSRCAENLWRGLPSFRGECSLRTWALRVAHNVAVNQRDDVWRRHVRRLATGEASRLADEIRTSTAVRVERQRRALETLREALTDEERSLLTLRIDQALSWPEIADVLSTDGRRPEPATLSKRFERLKGRLSEIARAQGLVD